MLPRLNEQNLYQVLDVSEDATAAEIQSAYDAARDIYSHDALVSGSILSEHERRSTMALIARAYETLIVEESRRLYDETLGLPPREAREEETAVAAAREDATDEPEERTEELVVDTAPISPASASPEPEEAPPVSERPPQRVCPVQLGEGEEATGEFLRRARQASGLELATISEETKIGRSMLEYIESERLDRLPAPVYLRSFTRQIARCLGLDEDRVSSSYLERIERFGG